MLISLPSRRRDDNPAARRSPARRPIVEVLEGRQLLSAFTGDIARTMAPEIQGCYNGESVADSPDGHAKTI